MLIPLLLLYDQYIKCFDDFHDGFRWILVTLVVVV